LAAYAATRFSISPARAAGYPPPRPRLQFAPDVGPERLGAEPDDDEQDLLLELP